MLSNLPIHWTVAGAAWASRVATIGVRLSLLFLFTRYLTVSEYAIYAVLSSLEGWFALVDCGIGSSLQNYLSEARAKQEPDHQPLISAGQLAIGLWICFSLLLYWGYQPLGHMLLSHLDPHFNNYSLLTVGMCFSFHAIGGIGYRVLFARQQGYFVHLLQTLAAAFSLLSSLAVFFFYRGSEKLTISVLATFSPYAAVALGCFIAVFPLRQMGSVYDWEWILKIGRRAFPFLGLGILAAGVLLIDYVVMARFLGPSDIVIYQITSKPFGIGFFVYTAFLQALWPIFSELQAKGELNKMKEQIRRSLQFGISVILACTLLLLVCLDPLVHWFFPYQTLEISPSFICLFGLYYLIRIISDTYSTVLQSMSRMRGFFLLVPLQVVLCVCGQIFFSKHFGVVGILYGLIVAFSATVLWGLPYAFHRAIRKREPLFS